MCKKLLLLSFIITVGIFLLGLSNKAFAQCPAVSDEEIRLLQNYDSNEDGKIDTDEKDKALGDWGQDVIDDEELLIVLKYWKYNCSLYYCTDSDQGRNYYQKGTVREWGAGGTTSYTDYCIDSSTLKEYYCTDFTAGGLGGAAEEIYQCPYGCRNGACLRESELPDLIITSVEYTPSSPTPNDTLEFRVTVKNIGEDIESLVSGGIITRISSESLPSPGWRICDAIIDPLDSGESVVVDCPIFTYLPTGTHQFTFFVDYNNRIVEADESNNTYTIQVRVTSVQPSITVIAPNGGERWESAKSYRISWKATGEVYSRVDILLGGFRENGTQIDTWKLIEAGVPTEQGYFYWAPGGAPLYVPSSFSETPAKYKIKIREATDREDALFDVSDSYFYIISSQQEDPVTGTLSSDKTQAKVGENITLTISAQDDQGVYKVMVYYKGRWHSKYCNNAKECTKTWTFTETSPGTKRYYGYVYGYRINGRLEGKYTSPSNVRVVWQSEEKCETNNPRVRLVPGSQTGSPGETLEYTAYVKNNDSAKCEARQFRVEVSGCPWKFTCSPSYPNSVFLTLKPGEEKSVKIQITSSASSTSKEYTFYVRALSGLTSHTAKGVYVVSKEKTCKDTDGGKNYYQKGVVTVDGTMLSDFCIDSNTLKEHYCSGNNPKWVNYVCPYGCENGACKRKTPSESKDDKIEGTLKVSKSEVYVGEELEVTIEAQDDNGIHSLWVGGIDPPGWHNQKCYKATHCIKSWKTSFKLPGLFPIRGYLWGYDKNGKLNDGAWTSPRIIFVKVVPKVGISRQQELMASLKEIIERLLKIIEKK